MASKNIINEASVDYTLVRLTSFGEAYYQWYFVEQNYNDPDLEPENNLGESILSKYVSESSM